MGGVNNYYRGDWSTLFCQILTYNKLYVNKREGGRHGFTVILSQNGKLWECIHNKML